jgi:hypothetical protein
MGKSPTFEKIGECLYRNPSSGTYYALLKSGGKQIKRSLRTDHLPEARRKLRDFRNERHHVDPDAGRIHVRAPSMGKLIRRQILAFLQLVSVIPASLDSRNLAQPLFLQ